MMMFFIFRFLLLNIRQLLFFQLDRRGTVKDLANLFNGLAEKEEQVSYGYYQLLR